LYKFIKNNEHLGNPHWTYIAKIYADEEDRLRVMDTNHRTSFSSKKAKTVRQLEKLTENEFFEEEESLLYGPGRYCRVTISASKLLLNMNKVKL